MKRQIWAIPGRPHEWEVVEFADDYDNNPNREPHTAMIATLEECRAEYPDAVVEWPNNTHPMETG